MGASDPVRIGYTPGQDVTLDHLQDQIEWYDRKSGSNQKAFKYLKICTISAAALIPVLAKVTAMSSYTAGLGVFIVVLEGLQQLNQYHSNWISYRSTCEALKHEKFLYLGKAGIYAAPMTHMPSWLSGSNLWFPRNMQNGRPVRSRAKRSALPLLRNIEPA
jgi:hypothetical protein